MEIPNYLYGINNKTFSKMKNYKHSDLEKADNLLSNIKPSHNEPFLVKSGWQQGLYEKEVTNYNGNGPVIRVYGDSPEIAEALALIVCRKISVNNDYETAGGTYDGLQKINNLPL